MSTHRDPDPQRSTLPRSTPRTEAQEARRRFLKVTGAAALAVPVIESVTGKNLITVSAQAQTVTPNDTTGPFTGNLFNLPG